MQRLQLDKLQTSGQLHPPGLRFGIVVNQEPMIKAAVLELQGQQRLRISPREHLLFLGRRRRRPEQQLAISQHQFLHTGRPDFQQCMPCGQGSQGEESGQQHQADCTAPQPANF